jgi:DNA-binding CsgD family transcriptional regulator/PAS domain-containing protein
LRVAAPDTELIQAILDAGVTPGGWAPALRGLMDRLRAPYGVLLLRSAYESDPGASVRSGLSQEFFDRWAAMFASDPVIQREFSGAPIGAVQIVDRRRLDGWGRRSPIATSLRLEGERLWGLSSALWRDEHQGGILTLARPEREPCFSSTESQDLERLVPFVTRAVEIQRRIEWLEVQVGIAHRTLDLLPVGVVLASERGEVVQMNREARRVLDENDGLALRDGRLAAHDPAARDALDELIAHTGETGMGRGETPGGDLPLERPSGRRPLELSAAPIGRGAARRWPGASAAVAAFIADPEHRAPVPPLRLRRLYGLTHAEARLASRLAAGESLPSASRSLGRSVQTARKQPQTIFEKTGTHRQAELVQRILSGSASLSGQRR